MENFNIFTYQKLPNNLLVAFILAIWKWYVHKALKFPKPPDLFKAGALLSFHKNRIFTLNIHRIFLKIKQFFPRVDSIIFFQVILQRVPVVSVRINIFLISMIECPSIVKIPACAAYCHPDID
jgi:hypothetical protein